MLRDLKPTDNILGFDVRPGYYDMDGATPVRGGVLSGLKMALRTYSVP